MKLSLLKTLPVVALALLAMPSFAQNLLANASFESGGALPDNWTATGNLGRQSGAITPGNPAFAVGYTDGVSAINFGGNNGVHDGVLSQSFATTVGASYTLTFDFGKYGDPANLRATVTNVQVSGLVAGDSLNETISDNTGTPFDISGNPAQAFAGYSFTFVATNTTSTLSFADISPVVADDSDGALDNVSVTAVATVVPEAGTLALLAGAVVPVGLIALRRRK